ncbi:serine protease [Roseateles asaccharophilus]|uniref:S1-C subfamily serine protease n=1 Tax=Roseateles asaccharophilus TaxID=582607 RepID=A0ABU2AAK1_9BURK|nr:serine protease [Roseateles asaccharophilus]MDR7334194.1 S1-C subfamily serine protease [Roseateles asaccharophilus]
MIRRTLGLLTLLLVVGPAANAAETAAALIARVKPSVVLVGSYGLLDSPRFGFSGTGFVVSDGRHVITAAHVLPPLPPGRVDRRVAIQHWTAESGWVMRGASVKRTDGPRDLALLTIDGPALPAVKLAAKDVSEGSDIVLIGFPLGGALGFSHVSHRGMVAALTAIAPQAMNAQTLQPRALQQLRRGSFEVLQLDATAYPGNSGGPVFDLASGEVVGVVSMVLVKGTREAALSAPSGISYAIKASDAVALLAAEATE